MRHLFLAASAAVLISSVSFAQSITHTVRRGETIESISRLYNIPAETLLAANPDAKNGVYYGLPLTIPSSERQVQKKTGPRRSLQFVTHTIQEGETFNSIAKANNVDLNVLLDANPFCIFKPGYRILIPQSGSYFYLTGFTSEYHLNAPKSKPKDRGQAQAEAIRMIETAPLENSVAYLDSLCRTYGTQSLPQATYQLGHYYAFGCFDTSSDMFSNSKTISRYGRQAVDSDRAIYYLNEASMTDASLMNTLMDEDGWLFNPQSVLFNTARLLRWNVQGFNKAMMEGIVECYPEYPFNVKDMYMDYFEEAFAGSKTAEEYDNALYSLTLFPIDSLFTILPLLPKEYPAYSVNEMSLSDSELRGKADSAKKGGKLSEAMYYYRRLALSGDADSDYESWKYLNEFLTSTVGKHDAALILSNLLHDYGADNKAISGYAAVVDKYLDEYNAEQKRLARMRREEEERRAEEAREQRRREERRRQELSAGWQSFFNSFGYAMYNTYFPSVPSYSVPSVNMGTTAPGYVQPGWVTQLQLSAMGDQVRQAQLESVMRDSQKNLELAAWVAEQESIKELKFKAELIKGGIAVDSYVPPSSNTEWNISDEFNERNRIRNEERDAKLQEMKESMHHYSFQDCNHCHGYGKCQTCNGSGLYTASTGTTSECPNCYIEYGRRTGLCKFCQGTGKRYSLNK